MDEIYALVVEGKARQKIESDRGYAIANGINPQVIVDLKSGKSMPNAENMLKILAAAQKDVNDGIKAIQKQREAGFGDVMFLAGIAASSFGVVSLIKVTSLPYGLSLASFVGSGSLYIMLNYVSVIKSHIQAYTLSI